MNNLYDIQFHVVKQREKAIGMKHSYYFIPQSPDILNQLALIESAAGISVPKRIKEELASTPAKFTVQAKGGKSWMVTLVSCKADAELSVDYFRNFVAGSLPSLGERFIDEVEFVIPRFKPFSKIFHSEEYFCQTFIEGVFYGNYTYNKYKSDTKEAKKLKVTFVADNSKACSKALKNTQNLMNAVNFARDLQNEPSAQLTPDLFAKRLTDTFAGLPVNVTVFSKEELENKKMGGLLGVGSGSAYEPRLVVLEYSPADAKKNYALVGKGVTFDSGGISIKPATDMWEMKGDMSGAAVCSATVLAAALQKSPVKITAVLPLAENMPSGTALKPGDIITTSSGKTIEVDNTDAEGRIILSDALHYASGLKPDYIIDLATLTGACVVALGEFVAGIFTRNDELADALTRSSRITDELVWRMPMWNDYNMLIKSDVADVKNIGGRWGGAITAAKFLENWVDKNIPWVHIDIAGPAAPHRRTNYSAPYFTGFGVRLLIRLFSELQ
ncbi:MAG: leucyl aminopeptidase [Ignavibacteria bacterium]|nr:leucyl aminopeptidase [Ignavibacteria bacterium]